jgi:hypothetical protein
MVVLFALVLARTYVSSFTDWSRGGNISLTQNTDYSFFVDHTGSQDFAVTSQSIPATAGEEVSIGVEVLVTESFVTTGLIPYFGSLHFLNLLASRDR